MEMLLCDLVTRATFYRVVMGADACGTKTPQCHKKGYVLMFHHRLPFKTATLDTHQIFAQNGYIGCPLDFEQETATSATH